MQNGTNVLGVACFQGKLEVAKLLLCHKVDLDAANHVRLPRNWHDGLLGLAVHPVTTRGSPQCGSTPLALAAYRGHADVVDWLLARNANPCHTNRIGRSIIGYAISGNHLDVVKALLRASASLDVKDTVRCCFSLSLSLSLSCNAATSKKTAKRAAIVQFGSTLLCMAGGTEVAQFLVDRKADINCRNTKGITPLMKAAGEGITDVVKFLLSLGAEPDACSGTMEVRLATRATG